MQNDNFAVAFWLLPAFAEFASHEKRRLFQGSVNAWGVHTTVSPGLSETLGWRQTTTTKK
jgi:hypothetical protein